MPVNHYMIPLEMDGRMLFSELWVDPDAGEKEEGRGVFQQGHQLPQLLPPAGGHGVGHSGHVPQDILLDVAGGGKLLESFHQLSGYGTLKNQLGGIDDEALLQLLKNSPARRTGG